MTRDQILSALRSERAMLQRLGVASLRLLGSAARNEAKENSDADFLVSFKDTPTFDGYMNLKFLLEDKLGICVDLVTEAAVRPELREVIERDAVRVA
jgi:predicted nucleotidyltransferase